MKNPDGHVVAQFLQTVLREDVQAAATYWLLAQVEQAWQLVSAVGEQGADWKKP
jgi:hypothetical protein